jgi:hypothetical protein
LDEVKDAEPAVIVGEFKGEFREDPLVHAMTMDESLHQVYNPDYVDSILTHHPDAKPFMKKRETEQPRLDEDKGKEVIEKEAHSMLFFKEGDKVVGLVAPIRAYQSGPSGSLEDVIGGFEKRYYKVRPDTEQRKAAPTGQRPDTEQRKAAPTGQASVGKFAKTERKPVRVPERKIEKGEYDQFKEVEVSVKGVREKTGDKITVRMNAKKALEKIDKDIELLNKIVECLE